LVALLGNLVKIVDEVHPEAGAKYGCGRDGPTVTSLFENNEHFLHPAKGEYRNENGTSSLDGLSYVFQYADDFGFALLFGSSCSETAGSLHYKYIYRVQRWFGPFEDALVVEEDVARKKDRLTVSGYGAGGRSNYMACVMKGNL
jgi:hypothetical protein